MATPGFGVSVTKEQLQAAKIVPDVVSCLSDELLDLRLLYKELEVANGLAIRKAQTQIRPHVELHGPSIGTCSHLYTLLMVDPDAPSPSNSTFRNFLHWLVVNIPGDIAPAQEVWQGGNEVVPYMGPAPPEGDHRYVFLLYEQKLHTQEHIKFPLPRRKRSGVMPSLYCQTSKVRVQGLNQDMRKSFDVEAFAESHNLGRPVGGLYYVASAHDELQHSGQQVV